jgi:putative transposase
MSDRTNPGNANRLIGVSLASSPGSNHSIDPSQSPPGENHALGWHSRGYLPHFESSNLIQHVTFHLADSLPQSVLIKLESELKIIPVERRDLERRKRVDAWIDSGHGSCVLRDPRIAAAVQESLLRFDSSRYRLLAWIVMPNHVHVLFEPINAWSVAKIVATWKKYTARRIFDLQRENCISSNNCIEQPAARTSGKIDRAPTWHREYWDRYIRDEAHLQQTISYIHSNPVKAGLVRSAENWHWSSAHSENTTTR